MDEVSIEKARARLGDYVNDAQNGTPVLITRSGKPAAMLVPLTRLTGAEQRAVARVRELMAADTTDAMRAAAGSAPAADWVTVNSEMVGVLKYYLLPELVAALERLGGPI